MAQNTILDMGGNTLSPDFLAGLMGKWPDMPMPALKAQTISNMPPVVNMPGVKMPTMSNGIKNSVLPPNLIGTPWQTTMSVTKPSISEHPCQGNGGKDCGCGGSCIEKKNKSLQSINGKIQLPTQGNENRRNNFEVRAKLNPIGKAFIENNFQIKVDPFGTISVDIGKINKLLADPPQRETKGFIQQGLTNAIQNPYDSSRIGNIANLGIQYSTGVIESITAEVKDSNTIQVRIVDFVHGKTLLDVIYKKKNNKWSIGDKVPQISQETNLLAFAYGAWISLYVTRTNLIQINRNTSTSTLDPQLNINGNNKTLPKSPPASQDTAPCIGHDLVCSVPVLADIGLTGVAGIKLGVVSDGGVDLILLGYPCVIPPPTAFIGDCCYQHDIAYYCAKRPADLVVANDIVAKCIAERVKDAVWAAYESPLSILCMIGLGFAAPEFTILETVDILAVYFETYAAVVVALDIYALFVSTDKSLQDQYTGFGGTHTDSCLCGGNKATTTCGQDQDGKIVNTCRNICIEDNKQESSCTECKCTCDYKDGKLIGIHYDNGNPGFPNDDSHCCAGTQQSCNSLNPTECQNKIGTCPTCDHCHWDCRGQLTIGPDGNPVLEYSWEHGQTANGLPCCTEPDWTSPCPPPDFCSYDDTPGHDGLWLMC